MKELFRDKEHLLVVVGIFAGGLLAFLVLRALFVPEGFGEYGHFRAGSLDDNRMVVRRFAGRETCEECHDDVAVDRALGAHTGIGCEACHGPLLVHASDPSEVLPTLPEATPLCMSCHLANVAKPSWFPQVDAIDHSDGEACDECHLPHRPEF